MGPVSVVPGRVACFYQGSHCHKVGDVRTMSSPRTPPKLVLSKLALRFCFTGKGLCLADGFRSPERCCRPESRRGVHQFLTR